MQNECVGLRRADERDVRDGEQKAAILIVGRLAMPIARHHLSDRGVMVEVVENVSMPPT